MATVVKTFSFLADAEGFAAAPGNPPYFSMSYLSTDGDTASGCLKVSVSYPPGGAGGNAKFRSAAGVTWEDWGVPSGSTVTHVQVTAYKAKAASNTGSTHQHAWRLTDAGGNVVHSSGDLVPMAAMPSPSAWAAMSAGTNRAIDASYQSYATEIRLELEHAHDNGASSGSADARWDTVELTITYESALISVATAVALSALSIRPVPAVVQAAAVALSGLTIPDPATKQFVQASAVALQEMQLPGGTEGLTVVTTTGSAIYVRARAVGL